MKARQRRKQGSIRILRPHLVIEMDGGRWTTSAKDPGSTCPRCGADLVMDDDTLFCDRGFMGATACNFQYTLTEAEQEREMRKLLAEEDKKARAETLERVKREGPPVFGQANPHLFVLPSYRWEQEQAQWGHYLS